MSMKGAAKRVPFLLSTEPYVGCRPIHDSLAGGRVAVAQRLPPSASQPLTEFESAHQRAQQQNPPELKVELRTRDGKSSYQLYEAIPIDLVFTREKFAAFSIEVDEAMNRV